MRLVSLEVSGFRGFAQRREISLDADAVIIVGANGNGKTSLFDAILWALTGRVPRLTEDDSRLVSLYSETGQARVSLSLRDSDGKPVTAIRSFDGKEARFRLDYGGSSHQGPSAEGRLIELLWPEAASASNPREALATLLTRCVYLEQDLVHEFIGAATREERFTAVSELIGAGRVTDLQASLEQAKRAWTTVTNQWQGELVPLRERLAAIDMRIAELATRASVGEPMDAEEWNDWWERLGLSGVKMPPVTLTSREATSAMDIAIKQLDGLKRAAERRIASLAGIRGESEDLGRRAAPDIEGQRKRVTELQQAYEDLNARILQEQERLAEIRSLQIALEEKTAQLRALAELALKHLDDNCPVCQQAYDKESTQRRLEGLISGASATDTSPNVGVLDSLLADREAKEKALRDAASVLRSQEQAFAQTELLRKSIEQRVSDLLGPSSDTPPNALEERISSETATLAALGELQRSGETMTLRLSQATASSALEDLRREAETLRKEYTTKEEQIGERNRTGDLAQRVIEALREASYGVVDERLRDIGPLLQDIWTRIDPHPAFRAVNFLSQISRGKGQLSTVLTDAASDKSSAYPTEILSSSQLNALAVAVFLALNLGTPKPPLAIAMLDDPLQSLDSVNLLGLVELFRRTRGRRQLLISTHDQRFGELLGRKLRPGEPNGRTMLIHLKGWGREGPEIFPSEIKGDPVPLRLVS